VMLVLFYIAAAIAVLSTLRVITSLNAVHALLYLVVSLLSVAVVFATLGAPFAAALEVIIYAGAIVVLFIFVVMLLNLGEGAEEQERRWRPSRSFLAPVILAAVLVLEIIYLTIPTGGPRAAGGGVGPVDVGAALFGRYWVATEVAALLLLSGLVGALHFGRRSGEGGE
jgi:NADH-quinone oxidoreductase subunit J